MFIEEAEKLTIIFRNEIVDIYHIGSTSVPCLKAKPIIDIMPVVNDINKVDKYNVEMQKIGYELKVKMEYLEGDIFKKVGSIALITYISIKAEVMKQNDISPFVII